MLAAGCAPEHAAHRIGLERTGPQSLKLTWRARKHDDDALAEVEDEPRRGPGEPERDGAFRSSRLFAHARGKGVERPAEPFRDRARDGADLVLELFVEHQRPPGGPRHNLDRAIVVRRPEAPGDDAEISVQRFSERMLEIVDAVTDDPNRPWLKAETDDLGCEKRPVAVLTLAADELRAGCDDCRAGAAQDVARRILCEVTTNVEPFGRSTRFPFSLTSTCCGFASASWRLFPSNDFR